MKRVGQGRKKTGAPRPKMRKALSSGVQSTQSAQSARATQNASRVYSMQSTQSAYSRPQATTVDINIPALTDPPICKCWENPEAAGPWSSPGSWSAEIFLGISKTAAINGAKACMCCLPQDEIPAGEHRKMHISLNNGEIRIDLPIMESVYGCDIPMYTQYVYCTKCRKFEQKHLLTQKPTTPICWSCCSL